MIPAFLVEKFGPLVAKLIFWGIVLILVILLAVGGYFGVKHYFTKDLTAQVKVGKAQTGAAIESGHQAVETIGKRSEAEANGAQTVKESQDEINKAADPGGVTDAGLAGLHRVRGQARPRGGS
jgi:hypothetical protein